MHCPEVWDIKHSEDVLTYDVGIVPKIAPEIVTAHHYNHSVSVVLPDTTSVPEALKNSLSEDSDYYRVNGLHAHELVSKEFIEAFVKKGNLNLLAINKKIDVESSLAIAPSGHLILSLTQEEYQRLGLEGKRSQGYKQFPRHVVTIDLKESSFTPGKKNYERVLKCLEERLDLAFDVVVSWDPPEETLCPSSVAAWFHDRGYSVSLCRQDFFQRAIYCTKIPPLTQDDTARFPAFLDWLGIFVVDGDLIENEETKKLDVVSMATMDVGQVQYFGGTGFFTGKKLEKIFAAVKEYVAKNPSLPWCALDVRGFADAPVNWKLQEHIFLLEGNNSYTFVFWPNGIYLASKCVSSNKIVKK